MSQDCNDEWELRKENVQPLRQGRVMATLQEALAQQETSTHTALQLKRQEFESEIRFYSGDDPLDVWDRYIKWTEQTFPQGGKESNLAAVLERAVKAFYEQQRYYKDPRFLNLWLKFANCCTEPLDVYSYLHSQEIGTTLALLYITWAEVLEARGSFKKADMILQEGLQRKAEPLDRLQSHHRQFQTRVSRQTLLGLEETPDDKDTDLLEDAEPQRSSLADLKGRGKKKVKAPVSRVGDALKPMNQRRSTQAPTSQQLSSNPGFAVFDENSVSGPEIPVITPQPWAAPPVPRAKENELSAGPWNSGRRPRSGASSAVEVPYQQPNFTLYVDESAQQQIMTPCKIEPSINHVLSARKPEKEEDPLQRVQNQQQDTQEKKEVVMYCKEKVYAGVDEFSFEEIRAEIYRKRAKLKAEEEMQAIAQKKEELQRKIEEMEKNLKKMITEWQPLPEQAAALLTGAFSLPLGLQGVTPSNATEVEDKQSQMKSEVQVFEEIQLHKASSEEVSQSPDEYSDGQSDTVFLTSEEEHQNEAGLREKALSCPSGPEKPFAIFDESSTLENQSISCSADHTKESARRPLAVRKPSESLTAKENVPPEACEELNAIEPLTEDAIVTGSYKYKSFCANPEDTCDFVRAAHLASTPFHGVAPQRVAAPLSQSDLKEDTPESMSVPLSQVTPVCEALCVNKLSPIMEASLEDTHSTGSSVSSGSSLSSVTQTSTIKYLPVPEKLELAQSLPADSGGISENITGDVTQFLWSAEQRMKLLNPLPALLAAAPNFHLKAGVLPAMEVKDIELGNETYCIKREYWTSEEYKMAFAVPADSCLLLTKGFVIKVYSQPVPWDFYVTLELQRRLNADFDQSFSGNCSCFLYQDGCALLHPDINCFTLGDIIPVYKSITEEVILLVVHDLLLVVEKLHKAEIVHGDLRPEVFFLGDRVCDPFANNMSKALKIVDFSHSLDLRLQSHVSLLKSFPIAQTPHGQQLLAESSPPYQVDLVGIADIIHLLLFGDHIQVYQENSLWKISQNTSKALDSDFWSKLLGRILNADGKSTVPLLKELREEISDMFDSSYQERLIYSLMSLGQTLLVEDFV
ncbi:mitotic checkpoint serine/threonine-protein kinase BUB1 beta [Melanerpes formicivorus]|uniref:mitotic checkpoint serine/threonine-protein kinase BUB1 beta n=1 Tax=Melanerpes formicivorus TaxID=211600 RepID=UPI00358F8846